MTSPLARPIQGLMIALSLSMLVGCSSPPKAPGSPKASTAPASRAATASAPKYDLEGDEKAVREIESDLGKLESDAHLPR